MHFWIFIASKILFQCIYSLNKPYTYHQCDTSLHSTSLLKNAIHAPSKSSDHHRYIEVEKKLVCMFLYILAARTATIQINKKKIEVSKNKIFCCVSSSVPYSRLVVDVFVVSVFILFYAIPHSFIPVFYVH